jgi:hypothetical protein
MDANLAGRTAVVTGGSKGIGLAVVRRLAASGARVVTGAQRRSPEIEALARDQPVTFTEVDLADPAGPAQLVAIAGDRVDILARWPGSSRVIAGDLGGPSSQMITAPLPRRCPSCTPSNSPADSSWSSTGTARRRTAGSSDGPFGTAQERSTSPAWMRRSKWSVVASCNCTTNRVAGTKRQ